MRAKVYGSMRERRCVCVYGVWVSECGYEQKKREREREREREKPEIKIAYRERMNTYLSAEKV